MQLSLQPGAASRFPFVLSADGSWLNPMISLTGDIEAEVCSVCDVCRKNPHLFFLPGWTYVPFPLCRCCSTWASAASPLAVVAAAARSFRVHTPLFCRWLPQEPAWTNFRRTRAIYCHFLCFFFFSFVAWKWKAISILSSKLRETHYKHLGRECKNIWMLRQKSKSEHGFSVARSYFTCVKWRKYFPFSNLFPFL